MALQGLDGHPESKDATFCEQGSSLMSPDAEAAPRYAEGFAAFQVIQERLRSYYHDAASKAGGTG